MYPTPFPFSGPRFRGHEISMPSSGNPPAAPVVPVTQVNELQPLGFGGVCLSAFEHSQSAMQALFAHPDPIGFPGPVIKIPTHDGRWEIACQVFGVNARIFQHAFGMTAKYRSI